MMQAKRNKDPSLLRTAISKEAVSSAIQKNTDPDNLPSLSRALIVLTATEKFLYEAEHSVQIHSSEAFSTQTHNTGDRSAKLVGDGPEKSVMIYAGRGSVFRVEKNFTLRGLGLDSKESNAVESRPWLFSVAGDPKIAVVNCIIRNMSVSLDGVAWLHVVFKNCSLFSGNKAVLMADVSFENCWIDDSLRKNQSEVAAIIENDKAESLMFATHLL